MMYGKGRYQYSPIESYINAVNAEHVWSQHFYVVDRQGWLAVKKWKELREGAG